MLEAAIYAKSIYEKFYLKTQRKEKDR